MKQVNKSYIYRNLSQEYHSKTQSGILYFFEKIIRSHPLLYFISRSLIRFTNIFEEDFEGVKLLNFKGSINIIDIGASDGIASKFFSKNLNIQSIICFEPNNNYIKILKKLNVKNLIIDNFSISIEEDLYEGSLQFNLTESQANGTLTKLARKKIFQGLDLDSKNMKFQVNQDEFNIEGNVTLGGVDFLLKGKKNYKDKSKYLSKYNLSGKIDENDIEKLTNLKVSSSDSKLGGPYIKGPIEFNATYLIFQNNKKKIKTSNNLKETELSFPALGIIKDKGIDAVADIDFNFSKGKLNEIKIINFKDEDSQMNGLIKLSKEFKPYKSLELNLEKNTKKINIKVVRNKNLNNLI